MFYNYLNFIGIGYNTTFGMVDSDILLLDISNNDEYMWTNIFEPSIPKTISSTPSSTTTSSTTIITTNISSSPSNNIPIVIGVAIGAFIIGISLAFGGVFYILY